MEQASRTPPKCTITFHATLGIKAARLLADSRPADGSFYRYFQVRAFNGKRLREVDVYQYTPLARG